MKALRWHGRQDVRLDEMPEPVAGPGEVVVSVAACGLCGSDLHEYMHGPTYIPRGAHPLTGFSPPLVLGHEFAGRVVARGDEIEGVDLGDRVVVNPCLWCGQCVWCRRGKFTYCAKLGTIGLSRDGALAPLVAVPAYTCHPLSPGVSDEQAAFVEPLAVALHAANRSRLSRGESAAIVGAGTIGLLLLQVLRLLGVDPIVVMEPRSERRRLAAAFGATALIDPSSEDPVRSLVRLVGEARVDVAFECAGRDVAVATAIRAAGRGGRVVLVGLISAATEVSPLRLVANEKAIIGSSAYEQEFSEAVGLLCAGRIEVDSLVTGRLRLEQARADGLDALVDPAGTHLKILVVPN